METIENEQNIGVEKKVRKTREKKEQPVKKDDQAKENIISAESKLFDWKSLIPSKYLEISNAWLSQKGIDPASFEGDNREELKEKCGDENLIIKLAGFKHLAHIRGLNSVRYKISSGDAGVSSICTLSFSEATVKDKDGNVFYFPSQKISGVANANSKNTTYPFDMFLECMAENRSFIRAAKTAFNIDILGAEELPSSRSSDLVAAKTTSKATTSYSEDGCVSPQETLEGLVSGKGKTFANLKETLAKKDWPNHEDWSDFKDIPSVACLDIINMITKK